CASVGSFIRRIQAAEPLVRHVAGADRFLRRNNAFHVELAGPFHARQGQLRRAEALRCPFGGTLSKIPALWPTVALRLSARRAPGQVAMEADHVVSRRRITSFW